MGFVQCDCMGDAGVEPLAGEHSLTLKPFEDF